MWRRDPTACSMGSLRKKWKGGGGEGCTPVRELRPAFGGEVCIPARELRPAFGGKANMAFAPLEGGELSSREEWLADGCCFREFLLKCQTAPGDQ